MRIKTGFDLDLILDCLSGRFSDGSALKWALKELIRIGTKVSDNSFERIKEMRNDYVNYKKFKDNFSKKPKNTSFRIFLDEVKEGIITEQEALLRMRYSSKSTYNRFKRALKTI